MPHLNFTPFPVITTNRLIMRRLTIKDAKEIMIPNFLIYNNYASKSLL